MEKEQLNQCQLLLFFYAKYAPEGGQCPLLHKIAPLFISGGEKGASRRVHRTCREVFYSIATLWCQTQPSSFSTAARLAAVQNTSMAWASSAGEGKEGAMRI